MNEVKKDAVKAAISTAVGAAAGGTTYAVIGGMGLTAAGTAVGITLGPLIAIGAGLGTLGYGTFWLGKQVKNSGKSVEQAK